MGLSVVWFKRDLRIYDHQPFLEASKGEGGLVCLYVIEPSLWALPEYSGRQYAFLLEALQDLDADLRPLGGRLVIKHGEVVDVLSRLHHTFPISRVLAHEETGLIATWNRDKAVSSWAGTQGVQFDQYPQHGVVRGLKSRNGWPDAGINSCSALFCRLPHW